MQYEKSLPTSAVGKPFINKTPAEIWYGKKPDLSRLCVYGSISYNSWFADFALSAEEYVQNDPVTINDAIKRADWPEWERATTIFHRW